MPQSCIAHATQQGCLRLCSGTVDRQQVALLRGPCVFATRQSTDSNTDAKKKRLLFCIFKLQRQVLCPLHRQAVLRKAVLNLQFGL